MPALSLQDIIEFWVFLSDCVPPFVTLKSMTFAAKRQHFIFIILCASAHGLDMCGVRGWRVTTCSAWLGSYCFSGVNQALAFLLDLKALRGF